MSPACRQRGLLLLVRRDESLFSWVGSAERNFNPGWRSCPVVVCASSSSHIRCCCTAPVAFFPTLVCIKQLPLVCVVVVVNGGVGGFVWPFFLCFSPRKFFVARFLLLHGSARILSHPCLRKTVMVGVRRSCCEMGGVGEVVRPFFGFLFAVVAGVHHCQQIWGDASMCC